MRRILMLLTVALVMAAMMVAMAMPAFAEASDNASCVGQGLSEDTRPGSGQLKGEQISGGAQSEPGLIGEIFSTLAPMNGCEL